MPELDAIAETLRKRRKDLEEMMESGATRSEHTDELVARIEDLSRRTEETQRRFLAISESKSPIT